MKNRNEDISSHDRYAKKRIKPQLKELTDEERNVILPVLVDYFKKKTNDLVHITAPQIISDFNKHKEKVGMKHNFNNPRLMKLTAYIRYMEILPLISGSSGYYVSSNYQTIEECAVSLEQRAEAIMAAAKGMKNQAQAIKLQQQNVEDPFGIADWK
jgi:hypothetical protein